MILIAEKIVTRPDHSPRSNCAVVVKAGVIIEIGKADQIVRKYRGHQIIRLERAALMPGLVNVHAHVELPPLFECVQGKNYPDWVLNLLKAKKHLSLRNLRTAAQKNVASLIHTGTTTVAEICTHGVSPAVIALNGMRSVIYREVISMDQSPLSRIDIPRGPASRLIRYGISPHSPHTVSESMLKAIQKTVAGRRLSLCMHVAETAEELRLLRRKKSGLERLYAAAGWDPSWAPEATSPFVYLDRLGMLGPQFLAVHAVHADDADIAILKRSGTGIAHCPRSNRALGVGKMRLARFLKAGIPVGLGTDSLASSPSLSLWDEMRYAYQVHRRSGVTPQDIFHMATLGGARALGMDQKIGSLEPGKNADIIAISLPRKNIGDLYSDLLRETNTCIMSMVNGHVVYRGDADRKI